MLLSMAEKIGVSVAGSCSCSERVNDLNNLSVFPGLEKEKETGLSQYTYFQLSETLYIRTFCPSHFVIFPGEPPYISFSMFEHLGGPGGQQKDSSLTYQLHMFLILGGLFVFLLFAFQRRCLHAPVSPVEAEGLGPPARVLIGVWRMLA